METGCGGWDHQTSRVSDRKPENPDLDPGIGSWERRYKCCCSVVRYISVSSRRVHECVNAPPRKDHPPTQTRVSRQLRFPFSLLSTIDWKDGIVQSTRKFVVADHKQNYSETEGVARRTLYDSCSVGRHVSCMLPERLSRKRICSHYDVRMVTTVEETCMQSSSARMGWIHSSGTV
jgi:hypothetical protein